MDGLRQREIEYTAAAGYTDETGNKVGVFAPELAPTAIILDAELTLATPERLWQVALAISRPRCDPHVFQAIVWFQGIGPCRWYAYYESAPTSAYKLHLS